jgi:hypothetical protein
MHPTAPSRIRATLVAIDRNRWSRSAGTSGRNRRNAQRGRRDLRRGRRRPHLRRRRQRPDRTRRRPRQADRRGEGDDLFSIFQPGDKTILDFNIRAAETDVVEIGFFKNLDQLLKSSQVVAIDGITSTTIDYLDKQGTQTTLTLMGYNIQTDANVADHFLI